MNISKRIWLMVYLNMWRVLLAFAMVCISKHKHTLQKDLDVWAIKMLPNDHERYSKLMNFGYCLFAEKAFRNVILNRLHRDPIFYVVCRVCFPPLESLYINMPPESIGGGLYLQHGFSTVIAAKKIGENCSVNQQVTIGYNGTEAPTIGDNVTVTAGAIVIGGVVVSDGAFIGAGAVVTADVPQDAVVVGVPARVLRIKGKLN